MTKTLTLEVDESVLERAEVAAKERGVDVRKELVSKLQELGACTRAERQLAAVERMIGWANANPHAMTGPMPSREERNIR